MKNRNQSKESIKLTRLFICFLFSLVNTFPSILWPLTPFVGTWSAQVATNMPWPQQEITNLSWCGMPSSFMSPGGKVSFGRVSPTCSYLQHACCEGKGLKAGLGPSVVSSQTQLLMQCCPPWNWGLKWGRNFQKKNASV